MYFGMKGHIGADAQLLHVQTLRWTSGDVSDVVEGNSMLHGKEAHAFGDAGCQGIEKRHDANADVTCHMSTRPGKRRALNKVNALDAMIDKIEKIKAGIRAKVEHPPRVIKRQFGYVKVCYRGFKKNTAQHGAAKHAVRPVQDYENPSVSIQVPRIVESYTDYVNRTVWRKTL